MVDNFGIYPQTSTSISYLEGRIDGYPIEEHRVDVDTTENPVESGKTLTDNAVKRRDRLRLEGWVSDVVAAPGNTLSPDRSADAWETIVTLCKDRTLMTVVTAFRVYENMVIVRAVAPRNKYTGRALRVTLDLAEILFSDTQLLRFDPDKVDSTGPAASRTSQVDRGDLSSPVIGT